MFKSFGLDFDNEGVAKQEDDRIIPQMTGEPVERKDSIVYDTCFDDVFLPEAI